MYRYIYTRLIYKQRHHCSFHSPPSHSSSSSASSASSLNFYIFLFTPNEQRPRNKIAPKQEEERRPRTQTTMNTRANGFEYAVIVF